MTSVINKVQCLTTTKLQPKCVRRQGKLKNVQGWCLIQRLSRPVKSRQLC